MRAEILDCHLISLFIVVAVVAVVAGGGFLFLYFFLSVCVDEYLHGSRRLRVSGGRGRGRGRGRVSRGGVAAVEKWSVSR